MTETTKRKTKAEQIEGIEQQLEQLQNRKKLLIKQHKEDERKARNRRLYQRHGLFESLLPDTIGLADEQFNTFLIRTVANDYGRDKLAEIIAEGEKTAKQTPSQTPTSKNTKSAATQHQNTKNDTGSNPTIPYAVKNNNTNTNAQTQQVNNGSGVNGNATTPQSSKSSHTGGNSANPQAAARSGA